MIRRLLPLIALGVRDITARLDAQSVLRHRRAHRAAIPLVHDRRRRRTPRSASSRFRCSCSCRSRRAVSFDIGTSYAHAAGRADGRRARPTSTISGLTDTQIRGNYVARHRFRRADGGREPPDGPDRRFRPISSAPPASSATTSSPSRSRTWEPGFGGTGGIAHGASASAIGTSAPALSVRHSAQYDPFDVGTGGPALHYQPGNEYRARVGVDHAVRHRPRHARRSPTRPLATTTSPARSTTPAIAV